MVSRNSLLEMIMSDDGDKYVAMEYDMGIGYKVKLNSLLNTMPRPCLPHRAAPTQIQPVACLPCMPSRRALEVQYASSLSYDLRKCGLRRNEEHSQTAYVPGKRESDGCS